MYLDATILASGASISVSAPSTRSPFEIVRTVLADAKTRPGVQCMQRPFVAPAPSPSALAVYRAVIDRLAELTDAEFGDVDPRTMEAIPVPVSIKSMVVSKVQRL